MDCQKYGHDNFIELIAVRKTPLIRESLSYIKRGWKPISEIREKILHDNTGEKTHYKIFSQYLVKSKVSSHANS